ncbi:MAG: Mo-dependent nitrogenase C-terminal domain-containing protein [Cyanobacteria bacterium J06623_7]
MNLVQHTFEALHLNFGLSRDQRVKRKKKSERQNLDFLSPIRQWLDNMAIDSSPLAHRICKMIPSQCPFEREVKFLGRTLVKIPPMCKFNPLYNELVALRFRAICYLADTCGEDVSIYC